MAALCCYQVDAAEKLPDAEVERELVNLKNAVDTVVCPAVTIAQVRQRCTAQHSTKLACCLRRPPRHVLV